MLSWVPNKLEIVGECRVCFLDDRFYAMCIIIALKGKEQRKGDSVEHCHELLDPFRVTFIAGGRLPHIITLRLGHEVGERLHD